MSVIIEAANDYSYLHTDDEALKLKLWKILRFRDKNYAFNAAYRMKVWDGFKDFFDKASGKFLSGLLPDILAALKVWGVSYELNDNRGLFDFTVREVDDKFLPGLTLRDYQVDYINQALKLRRGLVCSQTGSGKTNIMIGILKAIPRGTPTLVLCNKTDLVEQNYDEIKKFGFDDVGRVHGKKKEIDKTILCVTWQSIKNIKHLLKKFKVLIVDEIHDMMSPKVKIIYRVMTNACVRIGFSATAFKFGGEDDVQKYSTKGFFGPPFYCKSAEGGKLTTAQLQERDILSTATFTFYKVDKPDLPYEIYQDAVTKGVAENTHFHDIVTQLTHMLKGRTIIMVERIKQGDMLKEMMPDAAWVSGKDDTKTRKEIKERLKYEKGNVVAIATTGIFNTGINVFIHNLINAAGGKADHAIIQRLGRGLRPSDDKEMLRYFDFYFTINKYLENHSIKRIKVLKKEGHKIDLRDSFDFNQVRID